MEIQGAETLKNIQGKYHKGCETGDLSLVVTGLQRGAVMEKSAYYGLHMATSKGFLHIINYHIDMYPHILESCFFYQSVVYTAAQFGHFHILQHYQKYIKGDYFNYVMDLCVQNNHLEIMKTMCNILSPEEKTKLLKQCSNPDMEYFLKSVPVYKKQSKTCCAK